MENNHRVSHERQTRKMAKHMADFDTFGFAGISLGQRELQHRKRKSKNSAYLVFTVTLCKKETLPKFNSLLRNVSIH